MHSLRNYTPDDVGNKIIYFNSIGYLNNDLGHCKRGRGAISERSQIINNLPYMSKGKFPR